MRRTHNHGSSLRLGSRWWVLILLITLLVGVQVAAADTAEAATIQVSPSEVDAGGQVEISGEGFGAIGQVTLCLDGERCANLGSAAVVVGQFSTSAQIPVDTDAGQHTVSACRNVPGSGWTCGSTSIQVLAVPTTTTTTPSTTSTAAPTTTVTTGPTTSPPTTTAPTVTAPTTTAPTPTAPSTSIGPGNDSTRPPEATVTPGGPPNITPGAAVDERATTTTEPGDTTTTTARYDAETGVPGSGPPSPPAPIVGAGGSMVAAENHPAPQGLGLGDWALVAVAIALSALVLWLVDRIGTGRRRARQTFLASARGGRR